MKKIIPAFLIFLPSLVFAISGDIVLKESLEDSDGVTFGTPWESCPEYPSGTRKCAKHIGCRKVSFSKVTGTEQLFARIVQDSTLYRFDQADIAKRISMGSCVGEPDSARLIFYRQTQKGYVELNTYGGSPCVLRIAGSFEYRQRLVMKTECQQTGTGAFFTESFYEVRDGDVFYVSQDQLHSDDMPHKTLTYRRIRINHDAIIMGSSSSRRESVAAFEVGLGIRDKDNGQPEFYYVEGSYRPLFRSESNAHNANGLEHYKKKEYELAIAEFKKAVELDFDNFEAYSNLGLAYLRSGNIDDSIESSRYVYENAADSMKAGAAYNLGKAFEAQGSFQEAVRFYENANSLSPTRARQDAVDRVQALLDVENKTGDQL